MPLKTVTMLGWTNRILLRWLSLSVVGVLAVGLISALRLGGAEDSLAPLLPKKTRMVPIEDDGPRSWTAWTSIAKLRGESWVQMNGGHKREGDGFTKQLDYTSWTRVRMDLELAEATFFNAAQISWKVVDADGTAGSSRSERDTANFGKTIRLNAGQGGFGGKLSLRAKPALSLNLKTGEWTFMTLKEPVTPGTETTTWSWRDWDKTDSGTDTIEFKSFEDAWIKGTAPESIGYLAGSSTFSEPGSATADTWTRTGYANFWPVYEDVELKLYIEKYAEWRPDGNIDAPKRPGGSGLQVIAVLRSKNPKNKTPPAIAQLSFNLTDTSTEPGVCNNWPLNARDEDPDMRLAVPDGLGAVASVDSDGRTLAYEQLIPVQANGVQEQGGIARIDSYDFGGRTVLKVFARLRDGRQIVGEFDAHPEGMVAAVELPYAKSGRWTAESWIKAKGQGLREDRDDSEDIEGQKEDGDGFTLYEEYRGWAVNGQRVEGDPKRKDFFVLNLIGGDAEPGIELFEQLSRLRVHGKLQPDEMSEKTRLMNGNRRFGPHRKDQHGVWVKQFVDDPKGTENGKTGVQKLGDDGAVTVMNKKGVAGRPGLVDGIGILARDNTESAFNRPFNLPKQEASLAYDRAIAHELLHSVGVEHHGRGDYERVVGYISTRHPRNKLGRPYYGSSPENPIDLRTESDEDVAQRDIPKYKELREFFDKVHLDRALKDGADYIQRNGVGYSGFHTPQDYADLVIEVLFISAFMQIGGVVGVEHGEHSGAEDCLMRYYFAKLYESKVPPAMGNKMYYLIEPGTEHIGLEICHDRKGTGVNDAGHKPQSRYGDAAGDAGKCFEQICPNDAIPPRKTK